MPRSYGHFCPVARALEKIGDKWSLLIIRDLLVGPQRFSDLLGYLHPITPKWLTQRLRELERSGIVARESLPGRREVRYQLTTAGRELGPIVEALASWGFRHAMRPPLPGETVHPDLLMRSLTASLNKSGRRLSRKRQWLIRFPLRRFLLVFDQDGWRYQATEAEEGDLTISSTPEQWARVFTAPRSERSLLVKEIQLEGSPARIKEFLDLFGLPPVKPFARWSRPQKEVEGRLLSRHSGKGPHPIRYNNQDCAGKESSACEGERSS